MIILEDSRQQLGKHDTKHKWFAEHGVEIQNFFRKMDAIFWPYSNDEVKVNTNLKQNPSYGSGENNSYQTTK